MWWEVRRDGRNQEPLSCHLTQRSSLLPCLSFCSCYPIWKNSTHRCARLVLLALVVLLLSLGLFASLELLTSLALNAWLVGITCITYITCITCITCIREATKKSWYFLGIFPKKGGRGRSGIPKLYVKFWWPLFLAITFTFLFLNLAKTQILL